MDHTLCVGLFGTCGKSTWRDKFMEEYKDKGIPFFNPQLAEGEWKSEFADIEAAHLATDRVVLFPITGETYGTGSLAETGFSVLQAIQLNSRRYVILMIDEELDSELMKNEVAASESLRARQLVRAHINKLNLANVYFVETLEKMLELSISLYEAELMLDEEKEFRCTG